VEVDAGGDLEYDDHGDDPVDGEAERRPPAGVGYEPGSVLPEVLEAMGGVARHDQPRRSGDRGGGEDDEEAGHAALDGHDDRSPVRDREADVDGGDQRNGERMDRRAR